MPLVNNKVGDGGTDKADGEALVGSLVKVVACYRHLASCMGSCADNLQLRDELRQTREKAQNLSATICQHLTKQLRDKTLPQEQRQETERLWVAFSSSLELLHVDMCKVFSMGHLFLLANSHTLVQTGLQGGGSEVAARALSLPDLNQAQAAAPSAGLELQERDTMEREIGQIDRMIDDMEEKVNVLRWMVEPRGPELADGLGSADSGSLALISVDEEQPGHQAPCQQHSHLFVLSLLIAAITLATTLFVCVIFFS